jgi:Tfp pilus assembly protein PilZ
LADFEDSVAMPGVARSLHLVFQSATAFREEYARNLVKGGAFVPTREPLALRELVEVVLEVPFAGEKLVLQAEVVHYVEGGPRSGAAVQFLTDAPDLRSRLESILERAEVQAEREAAAPVPAPGDDGGLFEASDLAGLALDEAAADEAARGARLEGFEPTGVSREDGNTERTYRQRADRAATRIPVRVKGPTGKPLQARTRDISSSGILLSVDGEELPIGREVEMELTHPGTGEALSISGKVVRHVTGDGVVSAVAVQMKSDERQAAVQRFLEDVKRVDEEQQRGGIRGPLEELGAVSLLQMFAALSRAGTLTVTCGVEEGVVGFEDGQLTVAQVGSVLGVKALARIFAWREGFFEFRGQVDAGLPCGDPLPMEGAILEALRLLDEANRASGPDLPAGARLKVHRDRLSRLDRPLGQTEQAVLELATAGFTVRRILDVIPENDAAIRAAIGSLIERGLVTTQR